MRESSMKTPEVLEGKCKDFEDIKTIGLINNTG